jgi:hypothetical protein
MRINTKVLVLNLFNMAFVGEFFMIYRVKLNPKKSSVNAKIIFLRRR